MLERKRERGREREKSRLAFVARALVVVVVGRRRRRLDYLFRCLLLQQLSDEFCGATKRRRRQRRRGGLSCKSCCVLEQLYGRKREGLFAASTRAGQVHWAGRSSLVGEAAAAANSPCRPAKLTVAQVGRRWKMGQTRTSLRSKRAGEGGGGGGGADGGGGQRRGR